MAEGIRKHKIELVFGYTDASGVNHKEVEFGRRLLCSDLFEIEEDPQSTKPTQARLMNVAVTITRFGTLTMPVPLKVLMSLGSRDRRDLISAHNKFTNETATEMRKIPALPIGAVQLGTGITLEGVTYTIATFGKQLTGYEESEGDEFENIKGQCFSLGKEITRLSQADGDRVREGGIDLVDFASVEADDLFKLLAGEAAWLNSFRREGRELAQASGA